ncbi:transcription factor AP-2 domain-containing protein [Ditylenchus destructor]|uniref:Transcription factor AP-2 domain-containing protein n=1 Tax=Ditylenchus destructor TaxID=166010 RepID=A0AAD4ML65_9BILA|nr:transcription factor AP-2 domain-containing protein [Ditylenchus destructor]
MSQAEIQRRRNMILAMRTILTEMKDLLNQDQSPLCASTPRPVLDHSIQKHLTHFSLIFRFKLKMNSGVLFGLLFVVCLLGGVMSDCTWEHCKPDVANSCCPGHVCKAIGVSVHHCIKCGNNIGAKCQFIGGCCSGLECDPITSQCKVA